jgi:hypothetical protein
LFTDAAYRQGYKARGLGFIEKLANGTKSEIASISRQGSIIEGDYSVICATTTDRAAHLTRTMTSVVRFVLKRTDGTSEPFSADPLSTLIEVIGAGPLADLQIFKNGQLINKYLTLNHENITDGSVLFAARHILHIRRRRQACLIPIDFLSFGIAEQRFEAATDRENARISDVIWSGWEMARNHDRMLVMMRDRYTGGGNEEDTANGDLVLDNTTEIQETPLPCCFRNEDDGGHGEKKERDRRKRGK